MLTDTKALSNKPNIIGWTNPFQESSTVFGEVPIGTSIKKAITQACESANVRKRHRRYSVCQLGRRIDNKIQWSYIHTDKWSSTFLQEGELLRFRLIPKGGGGGGGKNPLRTILMLVVSVVAMAATFGMASYLLGGGLGATFASGAGTAAAALTGVGKAVVGLTGLAVMTMGNMLVNAIAPIKPPSVSSLSSGTQSPTYSISAGRNPVNQWGRVPYPLGTGRFAPPKAALPYTENFGDDMYLYELLCVGLGDVSIYDIRQGTTPIGDFQDVQYEYRTYDPNNPALQTISTLYPYGVTQEEVGVELTNTGTNKVVDNRNSPIAYYQHNTQYRALSVFLRPFTVNYVSARLMIYVTNTNTGVVRLINPTVTVNHNGLSIDLPDVGLGIIKVQIFNDTISSDYRNAIIWASMGDAYGGEAHFIPVNQVTYWIRSTQMVYEPLSVTRYTTKGARITLDVTFEGLVAFTDNGDEQSRSVNFALKFTNLRTNRVEDRSWGCSGKNTSITKRSYTYNPSNALPTDTYKIEIKRTTQSSTDNKIRDKSYWSGFRMYTYEKPVQVPYKCNFLSIKVKATGQLQGSLDNITVRYRTSILDYDIGSNSWLWRYTSNPASIYREILQSYAMARPRKNTQIDLESLKEAHNFYRTKNFNWNFVCDSSVGVFDRLRSVCAAGLSSPTAIDGRWAIIIDKPRPNIVMAFTSANSWGWSVKRYTSKLPNAIHSSFVNEDIWDNDMRIVLTDEPLDSEYIHENVSYEGVTNARQIYQLSRFHYAQAKLRRREISLTCFDESLIPTRGDLVDCAMSSVIPTGLQTGRIMTVYRNSNGSVIGIKTDQTQVMNLLGRRFGVKIYTDTGAVFHAEINAVDDEVDKLYFKQPTNASIEKGNKYAFGDYGEETFSAIVIDMKFNPDMTANITLQDYTPQLYGNLDLPIPDFESIITTPLYGKWMIKSQPIFANIVSDESVLDKSKSTTGVLVKIGIISPANLDPKATVVQLAYRLVGATHWTYFGESSINDTYMYLTDVLENSVYDIRIRYASNIGSFGEWTYHYQYKVIGRTNPPPPPIRIVADGSLISWELAPNAPIDIVGFYLYMVYDDSDPIEWGKKITSPYTKDYKFDIREYSGWARRVYIQTVDELLNVSTPVSIAVNMGDPIVKNIVFELSEQEAGWHGTKVNCTVVDNELVSNGATTFWGLESFWG